MKENLETWDFAEDLGRLRAAHRMPVPAWLIRPGTVPYDVANAAMHRLAERRLADEIPDTVILLEHPPVFTAGRRAKVDELAVVSDEVEARGGLVRMIDRGGSFTFHGPGQLVGYPILGLGSQTDAGRLPPAAGGSGDPASVRTSASRASVAPTCRPACGSATTRSARSAFG